MQPLEKQVGQRLRALREKKGISQEALAAACDLHRTYIGLIERGERSLSIPTIEAIASALHVSPGRLFEGIETPPSGPGMMKSKRQAVTLADLSAHIATIRQILVEANIVDSEHYEQLWKAKRNPARLGQNTPKDPS